MSTDNANRDERHLLVSFDDNYYRHTYVLLHSIFKNNNDEHFCVHVLYSRLRSKYIKKMTHWVASTGHRIFFYHVNEKKLSFCPINKSDKVTIQTYFRLFATQYLPENIRRVLYLDIDTCCVGRLKVLFETDMENIPVMAVYGNADEKRRRNLGLSSGDRYYQAGVLLINLEYWRQHHCIEGITKFIMEHRAHLERWDQDVISGYFKGRIGYLAPKYNVTSPFFDRNALYNASPFFLQWLIVEKREACEHPVIIHFTGFDQMKPWWQDSTADVSKRNIWLSYREGVPYAGCKLEKFKKFHLIESIGQWWRKVIRSGEDELKKYLVNEFRAQFNNYFKTQVKIEAASIHPKTFGEYRGINEGKNFVLCASGPSLLHFNSSMVKNSRFCGINSAIKKKDVDFDYVFCQDHHFEKGKNACINEFNNGKCIKFYGKLENRRALAMDNSIQIQRQYGCRTHTHQLPFQDVLSANARPYILSEYMGQMPYNIECEPIADIGGTVFSAIQFALFTNPKRIFLVGCDHTSGYFYDQKFKMFDASPQTGTWVRFIIPHMKRHYPGIQIISINPVGLKGLFRDVYTESYLKEHPEIKNATLLKDILGEDQ